MRFFLLILSAMALSSCAHIYPFRLEDRLAWSKRHTTYYQ